MSGKVLPLLAGALVLGTTSRYDFTKDPALALQGSLIILVPALLLLYVFTARSSDKAWRALARGLLSIPLGAAVIAFVGITLGAPVALSYAKQTAFWSLFMSTLMVAPAAVVLGTSWQDWQRVFALTRPRGFRELCVCLPAHGAAIGAWIGAWPMPLDWDRQWQEWPISCTYGAIYGYVLASLATCLLCVFVTKPEKSD